MTKQLAHYQSTTLSDSLFAPDNMTHYSELAVKLANTNLVADCYKGKPHDLFVAMAFGYKMGFSVEQSIQDIVVINGRPCMYGDTLLAKVMTHPDFEDIIEEPLLDNNDIVGYKCTVKRKGMADYTKIFTLKMAQKARLLGRKGPWTDYPDRMLQMRARAFAIRDRFPDAVKGIGVAEEQRDIIDAEYTEQTTSRTETLKNEIQKSEEINPSKPVDIPHEQDKKETKQTDQYQDLVEAGAKEDKPVDDIGKASKEQLNQLSKLMDDIQFTKEQLDKALEYYEADTLEDLPNDLADHFINKLKERTK